MVPGDLILVSKVWLRFRAKSTTLYDRLGDLAPVISSYTSPDLKFGTNLQGKNGEVGSNSLGGGIHI